MSGWMISLGSETSTGEFSVSSSQEKEKKTAQMTAVADKKEVRFMWTNFGKILG